MPANLNALIRYKTLDQCLSNPHRKWTIDDLIDACSSALKEYRGIYTRISERTIREDIRIMRSDILGFNAPIAQLDGNYYYEDRTYSIFNVSIKESELLIRVLNFILELQADIDHPKMEEIINTITDALSTSHFTKDFELKIQAPPGYPVIGKVFDFHIPEDEDEAMEEKAESIEDESANVEQDAHDIMFIKENFQLLRSIVNSDYKWSGVFDLIK